MKGKRIDYQISGQHIEFVKIEKQELDLDALQKEYPFLYGILGEALKLVSKKADRDKFPLWWIISQNDKARWEQTLKRAVKILNLKEPKQLKEHCDIIPEDLAGDPQRFRTFVAEMHTLIKLADFHFEKFEKIPRKIGEPTPDYLAYFNQTPFTIEVCYARPKKNKEFLALAGSWYDVGKLMKAFEVMVEEKLPKFKRQLSAYPEHKKLAAMVYEGLEATATFLDQDDADRIGQNLLKKANGTIDSFLITSMIFDQSSFLVPGHRQSPN
ncbi:MAG: hypothetical protein L0Y74_05345 [candidate division Zixibacteria bacterium]|nr:hypothetical protein [candidate division Zixibacteria bacterium]